MRAYKEIMERIQVTQEMTQQILTRLEDGDQRPASVRTFPSRRWAALAAACLVLVLTGTFLLPVLHRQPLEPGPVQTVPDITAAATAQELEELVGFSVETLDGLPFTPTDVIYTSYWGKMAEIKYVGQEQTIVYRKAPGTEDVSGDYTAYTTIRQEEINGLDLTLKGDGESCGLILWQQGEFSCSLHLEPQMDFNTAAEIVADIQS